MKAWGAPEAAIKCIHVIETLLQNENAGNTWMPRNNIKYDNEIISLLKAQERIVVHGKYVALTKTYEDEGDIAVILKEIGDCDPELVFDHDVLHEFIEDNGFYTTEQKKAVANLVNNRISILTGGPGTGKTKTVSAVLRVLHESDCLNSGVVLLAPTGKAVSRIMTMLKTDGYDTYGIRTQTIHRFIYSTMKDRETGQSLSTPHVIVVDEMSMVDVATFAEFIRTMNNFPGIHLMLTGDPDQLPSIGCGNVFADIIASGVFALVKLTKIQRQDHGQLLDAIYAIRDGSVPDFTESTGDFVYGGKDPVKVLREVAAEFKERPQDLLIITPLNATTKRYQMFVRAIVNPGANGADGIADGDRVIQCKNVYPDDPEQPRFNGMTGTIQEIVRSREKQIVNVNEHGERIIEVVKEDYVFLEFDSDIGEERQIGLDDAKNELDMAYILTVHKSQGSQAKPVIVIMEDYANLEFITRNLVYTAVSRAEKRCIITGSLETFAKAINTPMPVRRTFLQKWLSHSD